MASKWLASGDCDINAGRKGKVARTEKKTVRGSSGSQGRGARRVIQHLPPSVWIGQEERRIEGLADHS